MHKYAHIRFFFTCDDLDIVILILIKIEKYFH